VGQETPLNHIKAGQISLVGQFGTTPWSSPSWRCSYRRVLDIVRMGTHSNVRRGQERIRDQTETHSKREGGRVSDCRGGKGRTVHPLRQGEVEKRVEGETL
jgi:hypothetical protein